MKSIATHTKRSSIYEVIKELKMAASFHFNSSSNRKKAALNAEWLQELLSYKDETPITTEFLNKNFSFIDSDESDGIWAALYDNNPYFAKIQIDTDYYNEGFKVICEKGVYYAENIGQLRMFLTICGIPIEFIKKLK